MSRAEQIKTERRRRNSDGLSGKRRRLSVNEAALDREKYAYRWVNDEGTRIHSLTVQDDWEVVTDRGGDVRPDGSGVGAEAAVPVGGGTRAVLLRKPKALYDEDAKVAQRRIDETESGLRQGVTPGAGSEQSYVSSIQIGHADNP